MGWATAERFAREGFKVVLTARNLTNVQAMAKQMVAKGFAAESHYVDASDIESVAVLVSEVEQMHGPIEVLHYNAASLREATVITQPIETFLSDLAVNIGGALAAVQAAMPSMSRRGVGSILLTGGGFSVQPSPDLISLSIGKSGIRALTLGLFESAKAQGVHVATVTVAAKIDSGSSDATAVAEQFWQLHREDKTDWSVERVYQASDSAN